MPYEISKCRGPVPPGWAPTPPAPSAIRGARGAGRPAGPCRGGGVRARAGERPAALGAPGGDLRPGEGCPKVAAAGWARGNPRVPERPGRERGPGSLAVPCAPSKWLPPLPVEATGDRLRPVQGPSLVRSRPSVLSPSGGDEVGAAPNVLCLICVSAEKVFASLPQVERGVSKIIGGDPKGNNFLYTNGKCVILRNIDVSTPSPLPFPAQAGGSHHGRNSQVNSPSPLPPSSPARQPKEGEHATPPQPWDHTSEA